MRPTTALAWGLATASVALTITHRALTTVEPGAADPFFVGARLGVNPVLTTVLALLIGLWPYAVVGALVAARQPRNPIGWLFCAIALSEQTRSLASGYARAALVANPGAWPDGVEAVLVARLAAYLPFTLGLLGLLLFPTGRLPSAAWRPLLFLVGVHTAALLVLRAFGTWPASYGVANPLGVGRAIGARLDDLFGLLFPGVWSALALAVVISLFFRWRAADGIQRQQLKWFVYAATLAIASVSAFWLLGGWAWIASQPAWLYVLVVAAYSAGAAAIPIGSGIAIFRYRLYDIDFLINRTVVYVSVTGILAVAFAVLSAAAQREFEALTNQRSDLVAIAIGLVLLLGFAPLRRRIQPIANHLLPSRGLLALLFTDIVGSTARAVQLGDARWRTLLESYRSTVRRELARFAGTEIDTAGDGFFATFRRPGEALRCALALRESLHSLGLDSRIGLHAGECELRGERVSGVNVIVAARMMALAAANEIVVSTALRELVTESEFHFRDRGVEHLKGVPGEWHLQLLDA